MISSAASLVAAIVVREIWGPGAIIGAAMTPVIVALVSESLNKPAERVTSLASERRTRTRAPGDRAERTDRFGIWEDERPRRRLDRRHVRIAVVTGLVAFALVAVALTTSELVFGGSVAGGSKTTVFGGKKAKSTKHKRDAQPAQTTTSTQPGAQPQQTTPTAPA